MSAVKSIFSFLRWRLVPVRYAGKIGRAVRSNAPSHRSSLVDKIERDGHAPGPTIGHEALTELQELYSRRSATVQVRPQGHPFQNIVISEDFRPDHPLMHFAFSPQVLDVADDYFGGRFIFDSIQVLYSWPTEGAPRASQMWHKDYGDSRSLHCVAYLNDVTAPEGGPFVFVDKADTRRIRRAPVIRRIPDDRFANELGDGRLRSFYGKAGESMWVDPAACYHSGSRCKQPRLATFVTFNTDKPFVAPTTPMCEHRKHLHEVAAELRPDLNDAYLRRLFQL
jgi:hypothetical protein